MAETKMLRFSLDVTDGQDQERECKSDVQIILDDLEIKSENPELRRDSEYTVSVT